MAVKTYDFKQISASFGTVILSGFAEDDAITLTPEANIYDAKKGCDGQTTRSRSNNDDYKATIRFMATSDAKSQMQELTLRNAALSGLTYPFRLISNSTNEFYFSPEAWVEKLPDADFGREVGEREYTVYLPDCLISAAEALSSIFGFLG